MEINSNKSAKNRENTIELSHTKINNKSYYFIEIQDQLFKRISERRYYYLFSCGIPSSVPMLQLRNDGTKLIQSFKLSENDFNNLLIDYRQGIK